jgi:predicted transcriptional regulator of viral defense system
MKREYFTLDRWIRLLQELGRQGGRILSLTALSQASGLSQGTTRKAVYRLEKKGYLRRVARGLYANRFLPPTLEELAMILGRPGYISFESALERWGLISQMPLVLTCASTRRSGWKHTPYGEIVFHRLKPGLFFGFRPEESGILWAEPEKAVLDFIYIKLKTRGGVPPLDELVWEQLDLGKLSEWAEHYPRSVEWTLTTHACETDRIGSGIRSPTPPPPAWTEEPPHDESSGQ